MAMPSETEVNDILYDFQHSPRPPGRMLAAYGRGRPVCLHAFEQYKRG